MPGASRDTGARVVVVGKPDCSLCVPVKALVSQVCGELGIAWDERSILDDPALYDEYWERIPVVLVDGSVIATWRLAELELRAALVG